MKGRHGRYKLHGARSPTRGQHGPRRQRPSAAGTPEGRAERSLDDVDDLLQRSVGGREVLGRGVPSSVHDRIAVATSVGSEREPKPVPAVGPLSAESTRTPLARSSRSMAIDAAWRAVLPDA